MNPPLIAFTEDIQDRNVKLRWPDEYKISQDSHWPGKLRPLGAQFISADVFSFPEGWGTWINHTFSPEETASLKKIDDERFEYEIQLSERGFEAIYNETFKRPLRR